MMITLNGRHVLVCVAALAFSGTAMADGKDDSKGGSACSIPVNILTRVQMQLYEVVRLPDQNGGIFGPNRMWSAIVDRHGKLCIINKVGDAWPGSRAIAVAKAYTANAFSNDALALSTANLYAATQPGGSLYGLNNSNPFNPEFLGKGEGYGKTTGGIITFGGGVPLYMGGKVIGGLGVSGDSACADHAIAYRMRRLAKLDGVPAGVGPNNTDNIVYAAGTPSGFEHPHCFPSDLPADAL